MRISPLQLQTINPLISQTSLNVDITTNTKYGHFIWIGSNYYSDIPDGSKIQLMSETLKVSDFQSGGCMIFALYLNGQNNDIVNVIQAFYGLNHPTIWSISGNQGDMWKFISIPLQKANSNFELYIETIISKQSIDTNLAIDDVFISKSNCLATTTTTTTTPYPCEDTSFRCVTTGVCIPREKVCNFINDCPDGSDESLCGTCNFENSKCGWYDAGYEIKWVLQTGPSGNQFGPQIDHTLQNASGSYLLTIKEGNITDYIGVMLSPSFGPVSEYCKFSFWMHMGPTDSIALEPVFEIFYSNAEDFYNDYEYVGSVRGPLGKDWKRFSFPLKAKSTRFLVDVYAFPMYSSELNEFTDIAIDDIEFENCAVLTPEPNSFPCGDGSFVSQNKVCNFIKDCATGLDEKNCGNCDFETSSCAWIDDSPGPLTWERGQAGSASVVGPSVDHTLGNPNGWYTFVAASTLATDFEYADLVIYKDIGPSSSSCEIEFYYYLLGNADDLVVYLAIDYETLAWYTSLFIYSGGNSNSWNKGTIILGRISKPFRLLFSAERFSNAIFDVAVDDIKLINCEFPSGRFFFI